MSKIVDLAITKLTWVPTLVNPAAPKVTELTAGTDLSCVMTTSYEVTADASDTVTESAVCEDSTTDVPTRKKYKGNLVMFRDFDVDGLAGDDDPLATFAGEEEQGYFVRRIGLPYDTAYVAAQVVEVYAFTADTPQLTGGVDAGYIKATVPLLQRGFMALQAAVVAT